MALPRWTSPEAFEENDTKRKVRAALERNFGDAVDDMEMWVPVPVPEGMQEENDGNDGATGLDEDMQGGSGGAL